MLISERQVQRTAPIFAMMASISNRNPSATELETGIYEIGHFGCSNYLSGYEDYPEISIGPYGVCDHWDQIKEQCPELHDENRKFVVTLTKISREDEPELGGWRWHKWGEYIGDKNPQYEYLYDEENIDHVYVFHIYEKIDPQNKPSQGGE